MRPSVNQVECHIGPEEVGDGSRDRSLDASQEGYLDDFYWFFEAPPAKLPDASPCSREQCVSSVGNTKRTLTIVVEWRAVVPAVIGVNKVGQRLLSRPAPHEGAWKALARAW